MKKRLLIMAILCAFTVTYAKSQRIGTIEGGIWNQFTRNIFEIDIELRFDPAEEEFFLFIDSPESAVEIIIDEEYRAAMEENLCIFRRKLRQVELQEKMLDVEIGEFPTAYCRFQKGKKNWYDSKINSTANFFSQKIDMHQFIIITSNMKEQDGIIKRKSLTVYIDSSEIKKMLELFREDNFKKYLK